MDSSIPRREALKRLGAGAAGLIANAACGRGDGPTNPGGGNGNTSAVTLSGSGFGTKDPVEPLLYQDYEGLALGANHIDAGFDSHSHTGNGTVTTEVQDSTSHSGSRCLRQEWAGESVYETLLKTIPGGTDLYLGHWFRWETDGDPSEGVFKWTRAGSQSVYDGTPKVAGTVFPQYPGGTVEGPGDFNINWGTSSEGDEHGEVDGVGAGLADRDEWMFQEYRYRLSTPGEADGWWRYYGNGNRSIEPNDLTNEDPYTGFTTRSSSWSDRELSWLLLFNGIDKGADRTTYWLYTDETLIDTTFARVIATDAQTYDNSTMWAPQKPTSWSDTEIHIETPNWSNFESGMTVYFHVFDSDDNHVDAIEQTVP